jgi:hypothetical protein
VSSLHAFIDENAPPEPPLLLVAWTGAAWVAAIGAAVVVRGAVPVTGGAVVTGTVLMLVRVRVSDLVAVTRLPTGGVALAVVGSAVALTVLAAVLAAPVDAELPVVRLAPTTGRVLLGAAVALAPAVALRLPEAVVALAGAAAVTFVVDGVTVVEADTVLALILGCAVDVVSVAFGSGAAVKVESGAEVGDADTLAFVALTAGAVVPFVVLVDEALFCACELTLDAEGAVRVGRGVGPTSKLAFNVGPAVEGVGEETELVLLVDAARVVDAGFELLLLVLLFPLPREPPEGPRAGGVAVDAS